MAGVRDQMRCWLGRRLSRQTGDALTRDACAAKLRTPDLDRHCDILQIVRTEQECHRGVREHGGLDAIDAGLDVSGDFESGRRIAGPFDLAGGTKCQPSPEIRMTAYHGKTGVGALRKDEEADMVLVDRRSTLPVPG